MSKSILISALFISFFLQWCSSENIKINDQTPYAVEVAKARSYYKAYDISERLDGLGVEAYIMLEESENGNWYKVLSGGETSLEEIKLYQKEIQNKLKSNELSIVNYQTIKDQLVLNYKDSLKENKRISSKKPNVPEKLFQVINKFPEDKSFIVKSYFIVNSPDSIKHLGRFKEAFDLKHDLPRGITLYNLMEKSEAIAEVIYEDNLFGDQVTIDVVRLKSDLGIELGPNKKNHAFEVANYFSDLILNTGEYNLEDKLKMNISSYEKFYGYKVTIEPEKKKNSLRTYFVLVSRDLKNLVFSQSTEKSDDEIKNILESLGNSDGLASYDEFHNSFYALPSNCFIDDEFICFYSKKLTNTYAKDRNYANWSKKMVGHWQSTAVFEGSKNKSWSISFFDILNDKKVALIYDDLYVKSQKSNSLRKEVNMSDGKVGIIGNASYPDEFSFPGNRFIVSINNKSNGRLNEEKMMTISDCLQLK